MRRRFLKPRNSLTGARYEPKYGPPLLTALLESWGCQGGERLALWRALCDARWSLAAQWREALIHFTPERQDARLFVEADCHPAALVAVLEGLVHEGVLPRQTASRIEERLLQQVSKEGAWYGTQTPP